MALKMTKTYSIPDTYSEDEKAVYKELIEQFRLLAGDDDAQQNILNEKKLKYTDGKIIALYNAAKNDINSNDAPRTNYSVVQLYTLCPGLLTTGALVCMCIREGLFQGANAINFSDSGLTIGMYDKTGIYQGWHGTLLQTYLQDRKTFKSGEIMRRPNCGFVGIGSEFGRYFGGWGRG